VNAAFPSEACPAGRAADALSHHPWPRIDPACLPAAPGSGVAHLWLVELAAAERATGILWASLSADERARTGRFHREGDRRHFTLARGMLRRVLGRYLDQDPAALVFEYGHAGKPFLAAICPGVEAGRRLEFNLSHSGGWALIAAAESPVGVDLEAARPMPDALDLARGNFAPGEIAALAAPCREAAFLACWTCKEAFVKALGAGLSLALDGFEVAVAPRPAALLSVGGSAAGGGVVLTGFQPRPGFWGALAYAAGGAVADGGSGQTVVHGQLPIAAWV
jgi:4'-phosphopantetheinyl transferase